MAEIDYGDVVDNKLAEVNNIPVTDERYKQAVEAQCLWYKTEAEIAHMTDEFNLEKEKLEVEKQKLQTEKKKGFWSTLFAGLGTLATIVVGGLSLAREMRNDNIILASDEFSPNSVNRTQRDRLKTKTSDKWFRK